MRPEPGVNFSCDKKKPTDFPVTRKNAVMRDDFAPGLSVQIEGFHPVPTLPPLHEIDLHKPHPPGTLGKLLLDDSDEIGEIVGFVGGFFLTTGSGNAIIELREQLIIVLDRTEAPPSVRRF